MDVAVHWAEQLFEDPTKLVIVQALGELHSDGQSPSQISPSSRILFPQLGWQSVSEIESQPVGQQLSSSRQAKSGVLRH